MPFGSHKHKKRLLMALAIVLALPVLVTAQEATQEELALAKDSFNQLWHAAAETTQKRAALEQNLAEFDTRVANAKHDLAAAAAERKNIREHVAEKRKLVDAIAGQLGAVQDIRGFYQFAAANQSSDVTDFVRYVASQDIAMTDSGPVAGGWLFRYATSESLGEHIEDQIATIAVVRARQQFLGQVQMFVAESQRTEERLHAVASDLQEELLELEGQSTQVAATIDEKETYIDMSWKEKQFNEAELKEIAAEAAEASAAIAGMQQSLIQINTQLKERKLNILKDQMKKVENEGKELLAKRDGLLRKDEAMRLLQEASLHAHQRTVDERNSDKKIYKRIEERKLELKNVQEILDSGYAPNADGSGTGHLMSDLERGKFEFEVDQLKEQIALMKDGVPDDAAEAYVKAKTSAINASVERTHIAEELELMKPALAEINKKVSLIAADIDTAEKESDLGDLPPIFVWPVSGPITAGYLDADYVKVFGVRHRAIDIAVRQNSIVRSISDGVVYATKDGGAKGYSYILVGHRDGYASLYGHVSKFLVGKGDIVVAGQAIALSGGQPGTHGAGPMTTGSHVHLEVTKDGEHVDPVSILGN